MGFLIAFTLILLYSLFKFLFKKSDRIDYRDKRIIFYHEDDYCKIELLTTENFLNSANNIQVVENENIELYNKNIKIHELESILKKLQFKKHNSVLTGFGSDFREESKHTKTFGKGELAIYYNYKNSKINKIWITNIKGFDKEMLVKVVLEIGKKWNLTLVDWEASKLVNLADKQKIEDYLSFT